MNDVIKKLTPEQALEVLMRLNDKGDAIREAVVAEANNVLRGIGLDDVADDVFCVLDLIDVQECWTRSGRSRDGYTSPEDAAVELIEEILQPYFIQAGHYHELGMAEVEATYCKGVILGIYRYQHESKSEFRDWAADIPIECAGSLLSDWRERSRNSNSARAMDEFIRERCPKWAKQLLRKK